MHLMKDKILELINLNPKTYAKLIKKDSAMNHWVNEHCKIDSDRYVERVYSAIYEVSNICIAGKTKKFDRWSTGFKGCGPAKTCSCVRQSISDKVKNTKNNYSEDRNIEINLTRQKTMVKKYGVEFNSQRSEIKQKLSEPKIPLDIFEKLNNYDWLYEQYISKQRSGVDIAKELNVYYSTVLEYCIKHGFAIRKRSNYSLTEIEIVNFIKQLGFTVETGNWDILGDKEIDIFVPTKSLAIEVNGLYWHSYSPKQNVKENIYRHLDKTKRANAVGIDLFHVTDWEWHNKTDIIKSMLKTKLGILTTKIPARKCVLKDVTVKDAKNFLDTNHLQGYTSSKYKLGLYYNDELVMLVTAGTNRFLKGSIELHRLATKKDIIIVGGASKLIKHLKNIINAKLISYCDMSKSSGAGYLAMGFTLERTTEPGYFWTDGTEIIPRYKTQKQKLKKWLKDYDDKLSESKNMFNAGYRRFWDCGNYVFAF